MNDDLQRIRTDLPALKPGDREYQYPAYPNAGKDINPHGHGMRAPVPALLTKNEVIALLASALRDANEYWCDENWPYGSENLSSFYEKHKDAINFAKANWLSHGGKNG